MDSLLLGAFAVAEQIESDSMRTLGTSFGGLSAEQITQCDTTSQGCDGGNPLDAYQYVMDNGGITTHANYPYTSQLGTTGTCRSPIKDLVVTVTDVYELESEDDMADYVYYTGPISVIVDASTWNTYTSGILSVCGTTPDLAAQAVGVYPSNVTSPSLECRCHLN